MSHDPLDDIDPLDLLPPAVRPATAPGTAPGPAPDAEAPWLAGLNPAQREAVEAPDGPLLVLAGAGTGKTRVLTTRLARLLHLGHVRPWQILCVTFTNKAAREMADRVRRIAGPVTDGMWLGTFHALGARILRRHAEAVNLKSDFTILDTDDQIRLLKQVMPDLGIDDKRWPPRLLHHLIQRWKDKGLTVDKVGHEEAGEIANGKAVALYDAYQSRLRAMNAVDFGDLLLDNITLFTAHEGILARYRETFHAILVDEYQDANVAQYLWLRLLAHGRENICCVGDDDQSIYGWRGAEVGNILRFEQDFPGARLVRLERNYRSTPHILAAASALIDHNHARLGKTLWTEGDAGDPVRVSGHWDGQEEARAVCKEVEVFQRAGIALDRIAILARAGFQTREFEERLITLGIPYRIVGGARFYEREEIRDAVAYLRLIHQPADDLAFERIVNKPARGIGKVTLQEILRQRATSGLPLSLAARALVESGALKSAAHRHLAAFLDSLDRWREAARASDNLADLAAMILEQSGIAEFWRTSPRPDAPGKLENLKELPAALGAFAGLGEFLEHISLVMENEQAADNTPMLSLMTLHAAKGLEFDCIFLPGWEEGLFPHQRALDENGPAGLEEERRLAYVGLTRARLHCRISFAANRQLYGGWKSALPSRFIEELPAAHVQMRARPGLFGSGSGTDHHGGFDLMPTLDTIESDASGGPGRRRMMARGPLLRGAGAIPHRSRSTTPAHDFSSGERCFHQKFGDGEVLAVDGDNITVDFEHAGEKTIVASFLNPV